MASSPLTISSEPFIIAMIGLDYNKILLLIIGTLSNYLGSLTTFLFGYYGTDFIFHKLFKIEESKRLKKAKRYYEKHGKILLLFTWIPIFGDLFCFIAGSVKMNWKEYSFWVIVGKFIKHLAIIYLADYIFRYI